MDNLGNHFNRDVTASGTLELIRKLARVVITFFSLAGIPLLSDAATLHHDPTTGYVTSITGLNVNDTLYDATFHVDEWFFDIWEGFYMYGLGGVVNRPAFWRNQGLAEAAGNAIAASLGISERTYESGDSFSIPVTVDEGGGYVALMSVIDQNNELDVDVIGENWLTIGRDVPEDFLPEEPFVSFAVVPIPPAIWLFGSGLMGLVGIARRKKAA